MNRHKITTATAPSAWASYLINGDFTGLTMIDIAQADEWIKSLGDIAPVSCSDAGYVSQHDARKFADFAADCQTYVFVETEDGIHNDYR